MDFNLEDDENMNIDEAVSTTSKIYKKLKKTKNDDFSSENVRYYYK